MLASAEFHSATAEALPISLASCNALLAVPNAALREGLKQNLHAIGVERLIATGNLMTVVDAVAKGDLDLLVCDTAIAEGDMCRLVKEIRESRIGDNPFLAIIVLASGDDEVRKAAGSGADDVLAKPFDPEMILEKLVRIKERRKLFVATSSYAGPDRRGAGRDDASDSRWGVKPFLVPNPLNKSLSGFRNPGHDRRSIESAMRVMNEQRVMVSAVMLGDIIQFLIAGSGKNEPLSNDQAANLRRLREIAMDVIMRAANTPYNQIGNICNMLASLAEDMLARPDAAFSEGDIALISKIPGLFARHLNIAPEQIKTSGQEMADEIMNS